MPAKCQKFSKIHNFPFSNNSMYDFLNTKKNQICPRKLFTREHNDFGRAFQCQKDAECIVVTNRRYGQMHRLWRVPTTKLSCACLLSLFLFVFMFIVSFLVLLSHVFNLNSTITTKPIILIYILSHVFLHSMKGSGAVYFCLYRLSILIDCI